MRNVLVTLGLCIASLSQMAYSSQTIVFIRHGEKPDNDSGQLTCQGLNRALALPHIFINKFGEPDAIFAAAPKQSKLGSSLRSLQTMSPTAIQLSLPINLKYRAKDVKNLTKALLSKNYANALIFVAWEHDNLVKAVKQIIQQEGGNPDDVPKWKKGDFDSIYIIRIDRDNGDKKVFFTLDKQGLNAVSTLCEKFNS